PLIMEARMHFNQRFSVRCQRCSQGLQRDSFGTRSGRGFIKQESPKFRRHQHLRITPFRKSFFAPWRSSRSLRFFPPSKQTQIKPKKTALPPQKRTFVRQKVRAIIKQTHALFLFSLTPSA